MNGAHEKIRIFDFFFGFPNPVFIESAIGFFLENDFFEFSSLLLS